MINVVLISDKKYLMPTKVVINSIIKNKKKKEIICIYVIGIGLQYSDFESILELNEQRVYIHPIIPDTFFENITIEHTYVSKAALYKFLIPELIDVDKVLYLDSDVLVLSSLGNLYETDLNNMYAAVVKDMVAECHFHFQLKHRTSCYFNSGMMLLNLKELRSNHVVQKLITVRQNDTSNLFMDQDTFNKVFDNKVVLVSPRYNYMQTSSNYTLDEISAYYNVDREEIKKIVDCPVILHLTDRKKPWNSCEAGYQHLWYKYAFNEDIPYIIQDIVRPWKIKIENQEFKLAQYKENITFYKNNRQFIIDDAQLSGVMNKIWKVRKEISDYLTKWKRNDECKIVIYGAGKMGQAVFKCLWSLNYAEQIVGFAVRDKEDNVDELYGKKILNLEAYKSVNANIIVAVKDFSGDEIKQKMESRNYKDILEISSIFK